MPKLLWVALPLLLAAGLIAAQALRRQPLSRHALNVWFSVLLLAYVLTTAGLGIFWVANQQLPVFDWHYLFGYGTVLLVTLHLAFNFRTVWRYFVRPGAPAATATVAARGRRGALGGLGLLAATGAAFALGMRHGRSELRVDWGPQGGIDVAPDPAATGLALVECFHAFSSHSRAGVLLRAPGVDWGGPPPAFKRYAGAPRLALPAPGATRGTLFDLAALGAALWHTTGVTASRGGLKLRASPSSGALFSTELYVASRAVRGLAPGLWHYDSQAHALERLRSVAPDDAALGAPGEPALRDAVAVVVATAIFRRSGHTYRDRTYRYVLADLGHALENLRVAAGAAGAQARFVAGFDETRAAATLGVDEAEEGVLAMTALAAAPEVGLASSRPPQPAPWLAPSWPAKQASALGVTAAVHAATSLRVAVAPSAPASTPVSHAAALPPGAIALPPATAAKVDVLDVGDAAAVFVFSMDRVVFAADPLGPARGYRHAFLEAGLVGERIYLDAVPRGLGVCAVGAFYDDEASTVVGVDPAREWVIHFAAPGVPSD